MNALHFLCYDNKQIISGKSLISKEKAIQTSENERKKEVTGIGGPANQVYFISMVGVNELGIVDEHEYIFDIFTKKYDFLGSNVQVISAQDLWKFYLEKNPEVMIFNKFILRKAADRENINIYQLVEFFIRHHPSGHYILDECPFLKMKTSKHEQFMERFIRYLY